MNEKSRPGDFRFIVSTNSRTHAADPLPHLGDFRFPLGSQGHIAEHRRDDRRAVARGLSN
jgi:hypothetical protein